MRGRTVPILNSASLQSASSYVQINIYDTNLKALRKRGVDVKHFLQHVGCRSVVMDVPIVSSEVKRPSRSSNRRLNKSFGGFTMQAEDSLLNESQRCLKSVGSHKNQHDVHDMSLDLDNGPELAAGVEISASNAAFNEIDEVRRGPLTSTPMVAKNAGSFRSFLSAEGTLDGASTEVVGISNTNLLTSDKQVHLLSEKAVLGTPAAGSSFAAFSTNVMNGMRTVNGNDISSADPASFCICSIDDAAEEYPNENEDPAEFYDPVHNYENSFVHSEQLVKDTTDSAPTSAPKTSHIGTIVPTTELHANNLIIKSSPPTVDDESVVEEPSRIVIYKDDATHSRAASAAEDAKEPQVTACKNSSSNNRKPNRRKRVRPASPQDESRDEDGEGKCGTKNSVDEYCNTTLLWRPRYGKNRLVDHVRIHWGKEVKQCKLCDFKADCFRKIRNHHQVLHSDVAYQGSLSLE
ncbi:hypothetical protein ANCDUO_09410 [Ancylostoma duodenale]|uniref:C2H2-type domain-containing protein n=1 Tax=Ancylostoma duodenale TaxID=51022 RepID=A0A0C2DD44_9BILA|nr:hypothetical protein ANCDUO_09410 [Ancylostoma duodenale]